MHHFLSNYFIIILSSCSFFLQGCRPNFQVNADGPPLAYPENDSLEQGPAEPLSVRAILAILGRLDVLEQRAQELTEELEASEGGSNSSDQERQELVEPRDRRLGTLEERIQELGVLGDGSNTLDQEMQELAEPRDGGLGTLEERGQEITQELRALRVRGGVNVSNREIRGLAAPHEGRRSTLEELRARVLVLERATVSETAFGAEDWFQYLGAIEGAPPLPEHIVDTLNGGCPFWPEKQVKDTHLLVLIPATVNGEPFSLNLLGSLIQRPQGGGHSTKHRIRDRDVQEQFGTQSPVRSYWVLMTRDVLEGSRGKDYVSQKALVARHANRTGLPYELPGALEAATAILSHYVRSGERLYTDDPMTYTRCQELVAWDGGNSPAIVGCFSSGGLTVSHDFLDDYYNGIGVAGLRRF
jgi:hypothetical protein